MTASPGEDGSIPLIPADDPRAVAATAAVQAGDLTELERLLAADPWLAKARLWHRGLLPDGAACGD